MKWDDLSQNLTDRWVMKTPVEVATRAPLFCEEDLIYKQQGNDVHFYCHTEK